MSRPRAGVDASQIGARWRAFWGGVRPVWLTDNVLTGMRWAAIAVWAVLLVVECVAVGLPFDRQGLLLWIATGAAAASIGRRSVVAVVLDFLPFAAVLVAYDYLRGLSYRIGLPTWWHPQLDVDRMLFGGHEPTVWLQEHLKAPDVRWYDVVVCLCYYSFFFLPYVTAGVMWLRSRTDFYRWSLRFVGLSFAGFALFALVPAAPPWAAALCTGAEVADHPSDPSCMDVSAHARPHNLLGAYGSHIAGAHPYVERIAGRGFSELHLGVAHTLWTEGFEVADPVAAFPSLHLGGTMLFCLFMWPRLHRRWRPVLVAYPIVMTFSLVYSGEHYVTDCIAGALAALAVHLLANRVERRRSRVTAPDTLEQCLPAPPPHGTMPSST